MPISNCCSCFIINNVYVLASVEASVEQHSDNLETDCPRDRPVLLSNCCLCSGRDENVPNKVNPEYVYLFFKDYFGKGHA